MFSGFCIVVKTMAKTPWVHRKQISTDPPGGQISTQTSNTGEEERRGGGKTKELELEENVIPWYLFAYVAATTSPHFHHVVFS